jgi:hypothetical protein
MASMGAKKGRAKKSKIPPRDTLTKQQQQEIEEAFDLIDTDGTGNPQSKHAIAPNVDGRKSTSCSVSLRPCWPTPQVESMKMTCMLRSKHWVASLARMRCSTHTLISYAAAEPDCWRRRLPASPAIGARTQHDWTAELGLALILAG